jgi:uncharacterized protein
MRYWRHYPRFLQSVLLLLMIFTLGSFSVVVAEFFAVKLYGYHTAQLAGINAQSPQRLIDAAKLVQGISSAFTFLLSALLFAYLSHPRAGQYLGLRKVRYPAHFLIVTVLMIAFIPLVTQIGSWMQALPLGKEAMANRKMHEDLTSALMQMNTAAGLLTNLLLFALLPAVGEELLFRGVVLRFSFNNSHNIHFAILISGALFALVHADVYNFLPIFLSGLLLGYIYYLSGSIWLSIFAHFLNNGLQVTALYLGNIGQLPEQTASMESYPIPVLLIALAAGIAAFYWLRRKATPLPAGWSNDFEELSA